ncbi:SpoIID/LytB domain-containing protein [Chitinophaga sp. HK235]|uniref:SpoIID/LytB domain-containing protein n=1 Tax=Chitinophaga sp. HK235 TaxID=2952571 RepID=UPI001BAC0A8C|nr:SpoIID/LytB domain-containing protein [Chitinophaga sp. HK235]
MKKQFLMITLAGWAIVSSCAKRDNTGNPVKPENSQATRIEFAVTDGTTGFAIPNATIDVKAPDGKESQLTAGKNGAASFLAVNGKFSFTVNGQGYNQLETYFSTGEDSVIYAHVNLDPTNQAAATTGRDASTSNMITISGYLSDADEHAPLANVELDLGAYKARTDGKGYFSTSFPVDPGKSNPEVKPENITLSAAKAGYTTHVLKNFYLVPGSYTFKIQLRSTSSPSQNSNMRAGNEEVEYLRQGLFDRTASEAQQREAAAVAAENNTNALGKAAAALALPTSIRVGLSCSCLTCSSVQVMSLESYTESGLDNEWISSWKAASLQAGAVAYRSYGAWHALHPIRSNYDISSTPCSQAWGSETASSTINAARATAGISLYQNGAIFRSEYSAENNNAGCGDGFSGTGSSWPCISDTRCAGRATNGHGRGMCQWGSSFWASDKDFRWILNHYYNPGGVVVQ